MTDDNNSQYAYHVTERRREMATLLHQKPWKATDLAERLNVTVRTVQRDFTWFAEQLGIDSIPHDRLGYWLDPDQHPVPSLELSRDEARVLMFAMRHLLHNSTEQQADAVSLLNKLAASFPGAISTQVALTLDQLRNLPAGGRNAETLPRLTHAWLRGEILYVSYQAPGATRPGSRCFQPVMLEASASNGATYVIGYHFHRDHPGLITLKLDRIRNVSLHGEVCPSSGGRHTALTSQDIAEVARPLLAKLARSWSGIVPADTSYDCVIRFTGDAAVRVREIPWRPTLRFEEEPGAVRMHVTVSELFDFAPWVLSWGADAEVIEPPALREQVAVTLRRGAEQYSLAGA